MDIDLLRESLQAKLAEKTNWGRNQVIIMLEECLSEQGKEAYAPIMLFPGQDVIAHKGIAILEKLTKTTGWVRYKAYRELEEVPLEELFFVPLTNIKSAL